MPEQIENRMVVDSQWEDIEKSVPFEKMVRHKCDLCGGDIYYGDKYYNHEFNNICDREDCKKELADTLLYKYQKYAF